MSTCWGKKKLNRFLTMSFLIQLCLLVGKNKKKMLHFFFSKKKMHTHTYTTLLILNHKKEDFPEKKKFLKASLTWVTFFHLFSTCVHKYTFMEHSRRRWITQTHFFFIWNWFFQEFFFFLQPRTKKNYLWRQQEKMEILWNMEHLWWFFGDERERGGSQRRSHFTDINYPGEPSAGEWAALRNIFPFGSNSLSAELWKKWSSCLLLRSEKKKSQVSQNDQ